MDMLIWGGAALTMTGVAALIWCIVMATRAKRSGKPDDQLRADLQRVVVINLAALAVSALGLIAVILGIILG